MILLPAWKACIKDLDLAVKIILHDISTRWNSTYDTLSFAVEYQEAIKSLSGDRKNDLRDFKLNEDEWAIAVELHNMLKVSNVGTLMMPISHCPLDPQRCL